MAERQRGPLQVRLSDEVREVLEAEAVAQGMTVAGFVRHLIVTRLAAPSSPS